MSDVLNTPSENAASGLLDRDRVLALLHEYTEGPGLRKHAYAVEAAMRAYALRGGHDEALWGAAGLLHDMDYEKHPTPEDLGGARLSARPDRGDLGTRDL